MLPDGEVVHDSNKILPRLHELFPAAEGAARPTAQDNINGSSFQLCREVRPRQGGPRGRIPYASILAALCYVAR